MEQNKSFAWHLGIGLALIAVFWFASWTRLGVLGEYAFFPLWLGYILTVDALVVLRCGDSLLMRAPREFIALFFLSAPIWWIFEGLNNYVLNWHYLIPSDYTILQIVVESTICFSTVIPAVFVTQELIATFGFIENPFFFERTGFAVSVFVRSQYLWLLMYVAVFLLAGVFFLPRYFFPFTWIWLFLFVDTLNSLRRRASLIEQASRGDWRNVVTFALAGLVCGFFWEMWNFFAMPKWFYTVPLFDFAKIFEMPLLGYGGYVPFAWELYAMDQFVRGLSRRRRTS